MPLKYLFHVDYDDGSHFTQNENDVSVRDPTRSAFYDVDCARLVRFHLVGNEHIYSCSLLDGAFAVDGAWFRMHEEMLSDLRLIFFRRHTHTFDAEHVEQAHQIVYRLGWQATDAEGKNHQHVMEID